MGVSVGEVKVKIFRLKLDGECVSSAICVCVCVRECVWCVVIAVSYDMHTR